MRPDSVSSRESRLLQFKENAPSGADDTQELARRAPASGDRKQAAPSGEQLRQRAQRREAESADRTREIQNAEKLLQENEAPKAYDVLGIAMEMPESEMKIIEPLLKAAKEQNMKLTQAGSVVSLVDARGTQLSSMDFSKSSDIKLFAVVLKNGLSSDVFLPVLDGDVRVANIPAELRNKVKSMLGSGQLTIEKTGGVKSAYNSKITIDGRSEVVSTFSRRDAEGNSLTPQQAFTIHATEVWKRVSRMCNENKQPEARNSAGLSLDKSLGFDLPVNDVERQVISDALESGVLAIEKGYRAKSERVAKITYKGRTEVVATNHFKPISEHATSVLVMVRKMMALGQIK